MSLDDLFKRPFYAAPKVEHDRFSPAQWLGWFLRTHDTRYLIAVDMWSCTKIILADHEGDVEGIEAMRAAYKLDGEGAAWGVLIEMISRMTGRQPDATWVADQERLPEGWLDSPSRIRADTDRHRSSRVGAWVREDDGRVRTSGRGKPKR